jgi:hypothetical protein
MMYKYEVGKVRQPIRDCCWQHRYAIVLRLIANWTDSLLPEFGLEVIHQSLYSKPH